MTIETQTMWLVWLAVGAVTGFLLNKVLPASHNRLLDTLAGAVGGVLGGLLLAVTGAVIAVHFNLLSIFLAAVGAGAMVGLLRWTGIGRRLMRKL